MDYYSMTDWVSNSMLKEFKDAVYGRQPPPNLQQTYDFGNLVDSMISEKDKVVDLGNRVNLRQQGRVIEFSSYESEKAKRMRAAAESDKEIEFLVNKMRFQYVITRNALKMEYDGDEFCLPVRIKMDGYEKGLLITDFKSTACTSQKSFVQSISFWGYDQQAAFYMDVARENKFYLIGIAKEQDRYGRHLIFKHPIKRGDNLYESGKTKYLYWAYRYYWMVHTFNTENLIINI